MPVTVSKLFSTVGLSPQDPVPWGCKDLPDNHGGVYVVSLCNDPKQKGIPRPDIPICEDAIESWRKSDEDIKIDGKTPTVEEVANYFGKFWLPNENILYIGQTSQNLRKRISSYYSHKLGMNGNHRGGRWIHALSILDNTFVYFAECSKPEEIEIKMLLYFALKVAQTSEAQNIDNCKLLPFANLQLNKNYDL